MLFRIVLYQRILNAAPCAVLWPLLFIHLTYNSWHLVIPDSHLATTSLFSVSGDSVLFCR